MLSAFDYMPATLAGMLAATSVVLLLYAPLAPVGVLIPWLSAFALLAMIRVLMLGRFRRDVAAGTTNWEAWRRVWNVSTLASGALWGVTAWLFYPMGGGVEQTGLIIIIYTYSMAALPVLAGQPRVFLGFAALCFIPMIVRVGVGEAAYSYQLAGELLLIISLTTVLARNYRQALQRVTALKLHSDGLLRELRVEKLAAEAARREAETANRAKTQFFAAASHDLRQPLHAMGLFAQALRERVHEPEVAQLVNSINESVDALDGLFCELLDITRLDSGGVEARAAHVEVDHIFRRLRLHFEPVAFEKGLGLRFRGGHQAIHADPWLVERILRNLVSNAIRYTHDGSVLVSCRRRGSRAVLQVWDTGVGIAQSEQGRVFDEFYQVPGEVPPAPEQRKGLGLGLAIVKRLARLMEAPLSMASVHGRGTVFTLALPLGVAPCEAPDAVAARQPTSVRLDGHLIVVIEDDPAVREGLDVLLAGWGATLASFPSLALAEEWMTVSDPSRVRPSLLIVDYRLEAGRTGLEALDLLRGRFGRGTPAIMVTGSTMGGHEQDAHERDFHLMVKPVLPNRLRAMISFKLRQEPSTARS